jgi:hypothetical protein
MKEEYTIKLATLNGKGYIVYPSMGGFYLAPKGTGGANSLGHARRKSHQSYEEAVDAGLDALNFLEI